MNKMKAIYIIINHNEIIATVYKKDNDKIIFIRNPNIDLEFGLKIYDIHNNKMTEDPDIEQIIKDNLFKKKNKNDN